MKLSIITINYNNAEGLIKTIESVITQNNINFEYIIVDGASTDGSVDIINNYSDKITHWVSEPDSGIYNAMNKGIKYATGEYILFMNSGDIILETANLNSLINKHTTGEDFIYFDMQIFKFEDNNYLKSYPEILDIKYFLEDTLPHMATFIKRDIFYKLGLYNEEMKICSDWAFFFKCICFEKCTFKHVNTYFSRFYEDGISSKPENRNLVWAEREEFIKRELPHLHALYLDWLEKKQQLYKLKTSVSIRFIKKVGLLKWFKIK